MSLPIKVSDPSQKYKMLLFSVFGLLMLVFLVAIYFQLRKPIEPSVVNTFGGGEVLPSRTTTSTVVTIGTSSTEIMATSTRSVYVCNIGANNAFIAFGLAVSTTSEGISRGMLFTTSSNPQHCQGPFEFAGRITGHASSGVTSIQVTDFR